MKKRHEKILSEWAEDKKWNPFNSYKLLAQTYRWRLIERGKPIPQPVLVTVDPINSCNLSCKWCNAGHILRHRKNKIEHCDLLRLAEDLLNWRGSDQWPAGVEAVCIAGGGEPLLHPDIGAFIRALTCRGIEVGVVTNGTHMDRFIEELSLCTWVGVSVDAGSQETYQKLKGKPLFAKVCDNIARLTAHSARTECTLGMNRPGYGVSYKYLLYNGNTVDVFKAAQTAKALGCKNFHLRPAGVAWDKLGGHAKNLFNTCDKERLLKEMEQARTLETPDFGVFGITHKFDERFNRANQFSTCHAVFMTCVFMPPREGRKESYCVGLCCDRRGDEHLEFRQAISSFAHLEALWGSREHWDIFDSIDLKDCPRCTYQPHNQIFEHVIEEDSMTYKFI